MNDNARSEKDCKYTFGVYLSNGQRKQGLKRGFLKVLNIAINEHSIKLEDGTEWKLYRELAVDNASKNVGEQTVKCIISFQVYEDGVHFAVARLFNETKIRTA